MTRRFEIILRSRNSSVKNRINQNNEVILNFTLLTPQMSEIICSNRNAVVSGLDNRDGHSEGAILHDDL